MIEMRKGNCNHEQTVFASRVRNFLYYIRRTIYYFSAAISRYSEYSLTFNRGEGGGKAFWGIACDIKVRDRCLQRGCIHGLTIREWALPSFLLYIHNMRMLSFFFLASNKVDFYRRLYTCIEYTYMRKRRKLYLCRSVRIIRRKKPDMKKRCSNNLTQRRSCWRVTSGNDLRGVARIYTFGI